MATIVSTRLLNEALKAEASKKIEKIVDKNFLSFTYLTFDFEFPEGADDAPLVFTSTHAVIALKNILGKKNITLKNKTCFCINGTTKQAAVASGFTVLGEAADGEALAKEIVKKKIKKVVILTGNLKREELTKILAQAKVEFHEIQLYENNYSPMRIRFPYDGVLFFSPSQVDSFRMENKLHEKTPAFCIGKTTAEHLKETNHKNIILAKESSEKSVLEAAINYFAKRKIMSKHLLIKALRGETVERPPVWMMRQAGRFLPEYIKLREKYDFFTRVQTPELACEITLQPIDRLGVDAAIIFSDILVVPHAMGLEVQLVENKGPFLPKTISSKKDIDALQIKDAEWNLKYMYDALRLTKTALNNRVPLIGFAGAPFTILCYMVEGKGSKNFDKAKQFCFSYPQLAHELLEKITSVTIEYLKLQVAAGADAVQVFDSWSGLLSPSDFKIFAQPYLEKIADALHKLAPVILFPKGSWYALRDLSNSKASAIGIDWCISPSIAREMTGDKITLQGNFDPSKLLQPITQIKKDVREMIDSFGAQRYIANLGHGIMPNVPVENAQAFVDAVKIYSAANYQVLNSQN